MKTAATRDRRGILAFAAVVSLLAFEGEALAEPARARLWYAVEAGVAGCPEAGAFQDRVAARIGYVPFERDAVLEFDVRITSEGGGLAAVVVLRGEGEEGGERRFAAGPGECESLADAMALAIALRIDPVAAEAGGPTAPSVAAPATPLVASAPAVPVPAATPPATVGGGVSVRLDAEGSDIGFHRRAGMAAGVGYAGGQVVHVLSASYEPLCEAPCQAALPAGRHRLGLSYRGSMPIETGEAIDVTGPVTLRGRYTSRAHLRAWGWGVLTVGTLIGAGLAGGSVALMPDYGAEDYDETPMWTMMGVGLAVALISDIVGLVLAFQRDRAEIDVLPY